METGETVKWGSKTGAIEYEQFPSFVLSQLIGIQPIQLQNFIGWMSGEIEGFDALSRSAGIGTTRTYSEKKKKAHPLGTGLKGLK